ncbi:MAG: DUF3887 domain-containing protein [Myxococcales bacterium]|nr:DUF3887 domain-containing protein [Myxococcales bacterium]
MKSTVVTIIAVALVALSGPAIAKIVGNPTGKQLTLELRDGQYASVAAHFNAKMKSALPVAKLKAAWGGLLAKFGKFEKILGNTTVPEGDLMVTVVTCKFEKGTVYVRWSIDTASQVAGLFFIPAKK